MNGNKFATIGQILKKPEEVVKGRILAGWAHKPPEPWIRATVLFRTISSPHTTTHKKGLRKQVVIFEDSDIEVQVCTAHNALIISQPARIGNTLHLIPAPFYFPQQYGSEVFQKNCADAQSHSSEAAALNMKTFGNWITRTYLVICSPKWWQREV